MRDILIVMIPSVLTFVGFLGRYFWERNIKLKSSYNENSLLKISNKLEKFYYPLYFNLNRLSNVWEVICERKKQKNDFFGESLHTKCMELHKENQHIVKENIVIAKPIPRLLEAIEEYDKHVTIYRILDECEEGRFHCECPRHYKAEYPEELKELIKKRIEILEDEYDKINYLV